MLQCTLNLISVEEHGMGALFDPSEQLREGVWAYFLLSIWQSSQGSYSTRKSAI